MALPNVPNLDQNFLPIPIIPFQANINQHLKALGYDNRNGREFDFGDCSNAWYILGLDQYDGGEANPVPPRELYEDYCQCLIARVNCILPITGVSNGKNQRRRYRIIAKAIETLSDHKRTHGDIVAPVPWVADNAFPAPRDLALPPGVTWEQHMARTVAPPFYPLPFHAAGTVIDLDNDRTLAYRSASHYNVVSRAIQRRRYMATASRVVEPTQREKYFNRRMIRAAEWEHANRHTDFAVQDDSGRAYYPTVVPCMRDFGNSLWHALSYQINGDGAGVDNNFLGLRGGRREKAWLYNYFVEALFDPAHPRHRAYTWLQQNQKTMPAKDGALMAHWGELSILRALATNRPHAGRSKWPAFTGIFQLISDFFHMEVIVFVGPKNLRAPDGVAAQLKSSWKIPYPYFVFGKQAFGISRVYGTRASGSGNGQLFFVTDEDWQHFDAVQFSAPFGDPGNPSDIFDTGDTDNAHRYGLGDYPFLTANGSLIDVPAYTNPAGTTYNRPADNPAYHLANDHALVRQARNDWDIIDIRWDGKMPILPSVAAMGMWDTEFNFVDPASPVDGAPDSTPTAFEPFLITSGGFWQRNNVPHTTQWATGLYHDGVSKIFYDSRNTLWAQGSQVEIGERRQEPSETHVVAGMPHIQYRRRRRPFPHKARRIVRRGGEFPPRHVHWDDVVFAQAP